MYWLGLLACAGLTFALKYGSILEWLRKPLKRVKLFRDLFECSLCLGFWSGLIIGGGLWYETRDTAYALFPFASAAFSWFMDGVIGVIQSLEIYLDEKESK